MNLSDLIRVLFSRLLKVLCDRIVPFQPLNFIASFTEAVRQILIENNSELIFKYRVIIYLQFVQSLRFVLLLSLPLDHFTRCICFDTSYLFGLGQVFNGMTMPQWLMTAYLYWLFYLHNHWPLVSLLHQWLFENDASFYLRPVYRKRSVTRIIQYFSLLSINTFRMLTIISSKCLFSEVASSYS